MALDRTAREANVRDSVKKYFVDNIYTGEGIQVTFDKGLSTPKLQGTPVLEWISVHFMSMDMSELSTLILDVYCCTRQDSEGFRLAQLRDKVMGYLSDTTKSDSMARIDFYRSRADGNWTLLGAMVVQDVIESNSMVAQDETKYKILTCRLRWSSKI